MNYACSVTDCNSRVKILKMCEKHYRASYREKSDLCRIYECTSERLDGGKFCSLHAAQDSARPGAPKGVKKRCGFTGCMKVRSKNGACINHSARMAMYKLSIIQLDMMLANGMCEICGTTDPGPKDFCIDHDHKCCSGTNTCGKCLRGVLCNRCNAGLGYFNDDRATLVKAVSYLNLDDFA